MCRWVTLISNDEISLSDVVLAPSNSMVVQSRDATFHPGYGEVNNSALNADGFGVGWYHSNKAKLPVLRRQVAADGTVNKAMPLNTTHAPILKPTVNGDDEKDYCAAAVFKDVFPAWNNLNLRELCLATSSDCIMAHIRAASPGTGVNLNNCHPFKAGRLLFCHNGRIFGYQQMKRQFLEHLGDEAFLFMRGTTDSEGVFGLILTILGQDGFGSPMTQTSAFGARRLAGALKKTLAKIGHILDESDLKFRDYSTCNFALTDGETMVVTRYCDQSPEVPPPSLYFAFGSSLQEELTSEKSACPIFSSKSPTTADVPSSDDDDNENEDCTDSDDNSDFETSKVLLNRRESKPGKVLAEVDPTTATFIVSSDPLTMTHCWHKMPRNSIMWCTRGEHPELRLLNKKS